MGRVYINLVVSNINQRGNIVGDNGNKDGENLQLLTVAASRRDTGFVENMIR